MFTLRLVTKARGCNLSSVSRREKGNSAPLHNIRVLDLSRVLAGPMCTLTLADYGAEVIKIEHPKTGDFVRSWPPLLKDPQLSCTFLAMNRNKKSVAVDFRSASGQELIRSLAQKCDILVENYVPGVLDKYQLDYNSLKPIVPRLIYCSLTGFDSQGQYSHKSGADLIAASMSGHLYLTGPEDGEPCKPGTSSIDIMAGLWAHGAILAALYQRTKTDRGCKIDINLLSTGVAALAHIALGYMNAGQETKRRGTEHENVVPYKSFKTKDGYVTTGAINDAQFENLCCLLGVTELHRDERFSTGVQRVKNRKELLSILTPLFHKRTTGEWCEVLDKTSLPYGPLNNLAEVFDDPQVSTTMVKDVWHPIAGPLKVLASPVQCKEFEGKLQPPPTLGQHTDEVLRNVLDYSEEKIAELKSLGIIK